MLRDPQVTREDLAPLVDDIAAANRDATHVIERARRLLRKEPFDMRPVDLNAVVMDVVQVLNSSAANEGVLLVADLDPDLPAIHADRVQLRQVAMNLVLNAVQATRSHAAHPPVVRVATVAAEDHASVTVETRDRGSRQTCCHGCSSRISRPRRTASEWVCRSAVLSSNPTKAARSPATFRRAGPGSRSSCRPTERRASDSAATCVPGTGPRQRRWRAA